MFYFTCNESKIYESFTFWNNLQEKLTFSRHSNLLRCTCIEARAGLYFRRSMNTSTGPFESSSAYQRVLDWVQIANARACHPSDPHPHRTWHTNIIPTRYANLAVHSSGTRPRAELCLRTISSSTFANIVIISHQKIVLHTDTSLTRARFQHN